MIPEQALLRENRLSRTRAFIAQQSGRRHLADFALGLHAPWSSARLDRAASDKRPRKPIPGPEITGGLIRAGASARLDRSMPGQSAQLTLLGLSAASVTTNRPQLEVNGILLFHGGANKYGPRCSLWRGIWHCPPSSEGRTHGNRGLGMYKESALSSTTLPRAHCLLEQGGSVRWIVELPIQNSVLSTIAPLVITRLM